MRQRTQWALGGVLTGTTLLGISGTLAVLTDVEQVDAQIGAGSLTLTVTPELRRGVVDMPVDTGLVAAMAGHGPADLEISVVTSLPEEFCADHADASVLVRGPMETGGVLLSLCVPAATAVPIAALSDAEPEATVFATAGEDLGAWSDAVAPVITLRFTLTQREGGFSDGVDVPVALTPTAVGATDEQGPSAD